MTEETSANEGSVLPYSEPAFSSGMTVRINEPSGPRQIVVTGAPERHGVFATARTAQGDAAATLTENTIVTVRGIPMKLSSAEREGFVRRDEKGNWSEVDPKVHQEAAQQRQAAQQAEREKHDAVLPPQAASDVQDVMRGLSALGVDPMEAIAEMATKRTWPGVFAELSQGWGVPEQEIKTRLTSGLQALSGQVAAKVLLPNGIDPDLFHAWVSQPEHRSAQNRAFIRAVAAGDLSGFRWLAQKYQEAPAYAHDAREFHRTEDTIEDAHGNKVSRAAGTGFFFRQGAGLQIR